MLWPALPRPFCQAGAHHPPCSCGWTTWSIKFKGLVAKTTSVPRWILQRAHFGPSAIWSSEPVESFLGLYSRHVHAPTYIHIHIQIYIYIYINTVYIYIYIHTRTHTWYTHIHIYIYTYRYIHVYVCALYSIPFLVHASSHAGSCEGQQTNIKKGKEKGWQKTLWQNCPKEFEGQGFQNQKGTTVAKGSFFSTGGLAPKLAASVLWLNI